VIYLLPADLLRWSAGMPLLDEVNEMGSFHVLHCVQDVDARDKRGHDELEVLFHLQTGRGMSALVHISD
jgi:hypothetical protein